MATEYAANNTVTFSADNTIFESDETNNVVTYTATTTQDSSLVVTNNSPITVTPLNNGNNPIVSYTASFNIILRNDGNNPTYVPSDTLRFLNVSRNPSGCTASTTISNVFTPSSSGDTPGAYAIPAGMSRTFNFSGLISKCGPAATYQTLTITGVNYGTSIGAYPLTVTSGLGNLTKTVSF